MKKFLRAYYLATSSAKNMQKQTVEDDYESTLTKKIAQRRRCLFSLSKLQSKIQIAASRTRKLKKYRNIIYIHVAETWRTSSPSYKCGKLCSCCFFPLCCADHGFALPNASETNNQTNKQTTYVYIYMYMCDINVISRKLCSFKV